MMDDLSKQVAAIEAALNTLPLALPPISVSPILLSTTLSERSQRKASLNTALDVINHQRVIIDRILTRVTRTKTELDSKAWAVSQALSPISALPSEVLRNVFRFAVDSMPELGKVKCATRLSLVCASWRDMALSEAILWNDFTLPWGAHRLQQIPDQTLDRAKKLPLTLNIEPVPLLPLRNLLNSTSHTLRQISIRENVKSRPIDFFLDEAMDTTFPALESLQLMAFNMLPIVSNFENIRSGDTYHLLSRTPNLKHLKLHHMWCPSIPTSNLVTVHLWQCAVSYKAWLDLLHGCLSIEEMYLGFIEDEQDSDILETIHGDEPSQNVVVLAHLRRFTMIHCPPYLYSFIFNIICAPTLNYYEATYMGRENMGFSSSLNNLLRGSPRLEELHLCVTSKSFLILFELDPVNITRTSQSLRHLNLLEIRPYVSDYGEYAVMHQTLRKFLDHHLFDSTDTPVTPHVYPKIVLPPEMVQVDDPWYRSRFSDILDHSDDSSDEELDEESEDMSG